MTVSTVQTTEKAPYVLYYNAYSICSLMVRYTLALREKPRHPNEEMTIEERLVQIFKGEQLGEGFLCDINPKGQVPVLWHPENLSTPLSESRNITLYIAEMFPSLLPAMQKDQILDILRRVHDINFFSLSYGRKPAVALDLKGYIEQLILKTELSECYRKALEFKLQVTQEEKVSAVEPHNIEKELKKAKVLLSELEKLLKPSSGPWMFGLSTPTVLDANLIPLIARLLELEMERLIPEGIIHYANAAMLKSEWQDMMQGRKTMLGI